MRALPLVAAALALLVADTAGAAIDDRIDMAAPAGATQKLTVTMQDDSASGVVALVATYRAVPPDTRTVSCPPDLAANPDARLIDEQAGPGGYSVSRSIDVPVKLHNVCLYRAGRYEAGAVVGVYRSSTGGPPSPPAGSKRQPTVLEVLVRRLSPSRARIAGRIAGLENGRGTVRLQRRIRGKWRTKARADVRRGRFVRSLGLRSGQRWRIYVPATATTRSAASRTIRIR